MIRDKSSRNKWLATKYVICSFQDLISHRLIDQIDIPRIHVHGRDQTSFNSPFYMVIK